MQKQCKKKIAGGGTRTHHREKLITDLDSAHKTTWDSIPRQAIFEKKYFKEWPNHPPTTHHPPTTTGVPRVLGQFRGFSEAS